MGVNVTTVLEEDFIARNETRSHTWISDEPLDAGGQDKGPKPTELLLSSLADCKVITVKMYANRKGWDLKKVTIYLELLEKGEKAIIAKKIDFEGDLDDDQIERLKVISGRCPVAKMLANSVEFKMI